MSRHIFVWSAVALWGVTAPVLFAGERFLFIDESEPATEMNAPVAAEFDTAAGAEQYFVFQPAPETTDAARPTGDAAPSGRATRSTARSSYARQARAPNMFGDSFGNGGQLFENDTVFFVPVGGNVPVACRCGMGQFTDLPGIGGGVIKVSENNSPVPADRLFFTYNGFQNALNFSTPVPRDVNVNRYTVGIEKTFLDGLWSVNVSMPIGDSLALNSEAYSTFAGSAGNLAVFLKRLNYQDDILAISSGVGVSTPTGADLTVQTHQFNPIRATNDVETMVIHNDALHLIPYVGFLKVPSDDWFYQGFLSLDVAANGNQVDLGTPATDIGKLTQQNLLHVDFSLGRWLAQDAEAYYLVGIAAIAEVHYTSTVQDTDTLLLPTQPDTGAFVNGQLGSIANRTDIVNFTAGFHFQIGNYSNLRVAGVIPARDLPNRQFDSEIQISFNRFF